jgi:Meiotically Up-regulated Gene 113 (MUG113) protein
VTKNHIIQEIQRTAQENGGKPLGRLKFLRVTGIKETDWSGKFWARWNDALKEAGFGPNQLQQAYEDSVLLDRFAGLARELGRVPVVAEMRLKSRADTSFPSSKVFERFGSKEKLVARVLEYVRQNDSYSDVVPIVSAAVRSNTTQDESSTQKIVTGFVYLMKSGRHYKIGRTKSIGRREWELGIKIPVPPKTIHSIETDDPVGVEAYWHKRFSDKRGEGEWFELLPEDIQAFKRWKRIV